MSSHPPSLVRLPTPSDAPAASPIPLPLWHKDVAVLDEKWADEAAAVLDLLSKSDYGMVQSNAIGSEGAGAALAYSTLLTQMQRLQEDTVDDQKGKSAGWLASRWDGIKGMFITQDSLPSRMEALLRDRKILVENTRKRLHGLHEALDQRSEVDDRAMELLSQLPILEDRAIQALDQATLFLAETPDSAPFDVFRKNQLNHRSAQKVPQALTIVREQLQNAVMLGAPLRDTIDQFIEIEQDNQNKFELSFSTHVSNLAVLQGLQQSKRNAAASQVVVEALRIPVFASLPPPSPSATTNTQYGTTLSEMLPKYVALSQLAAKLTEEESSKYNQNLSMLRVAISNLVTDIAPHEAAKARTEIKSRIKPSDPLNDNMRDDFFKWNDFLDNLRNRRDSRDPKDTTKDSKFDKKELLTKKYLLLNEFYKDQSKETITKNAPVREFVKSYVEFIKIDRELNHNKDDAHTQLTTMFSDIVLALDLHDARAIVYLVGRVFSDKDPLCQKIIPLLPSGDITCDLLDYGNASQKRSQNTDDTDVIASFNWLSESITNQVSAMNLQESQANMLLVASGLKASDPLFDKVKLAVSSRPHKKTSIGSFI